MSNVPARCSRQTKVISSSKWAGLDVAVRDKLYKAQRQQYMKKKQICFKHENTKKIEIRTRISIFPREKMPHLNVCNQNTPAALESGAALVQLRWVFRT